MSPKKLSKIDKIVKKGLKNLDEFYKVKQTKKATPPSLYIKEAKILLSSKNRNQNW